MWSEALPTLNLSFTAASQVEVRATFEEVAGGQCSDI